MADFISSGFGKRVKKAGVVTAWITKLAIWYPLKVVLLCLWKLFTYCVSLIFTMLIVCVITGVVVCCAFVLYIQSNIDAEYHGLDNLRFDSSLNTTIYYTDNAGNEILLEDDTLHGSENRLWADYGDIPQDLIDAFVSIEDERFMSHKGVDIKRTVGAVLKFFLPGGGSYGGSTITQQLIKNVSQETDATIQRKVQEIFRAIYVEEHYTKEEILEMYLNVIYLSQNSNGVRAAAQAYFGKDLSELTLVECAAIASIPKYPTYYDPLRNPDNNLQRRNVILKKMHELGCISDEELGLSYNTPLYLDSGSKDEAEYTETIHSYYIDAVIEDVIDSLMETYGIDRVTASRKLYSGGLQVVTNVDPDIQAILEEVYTNEECWPETTGIKPQSAMVVMDPATGDVLGIVGGRGAKTTSRGLNRATMSNRQCGSSIKPLSVYAYALDKGLISCASALNDLPVDYDEEEKVYWPANTPAGYDGIIPLEYALYRSKNTTAVRLVSQIGTDKSFAFLTEKLGFTTLVSSKSYNGVIKSDIAVSPLALGSFTEGVSVLEMTQAYTMFANGGVVTEARTFSLVRDSAGEIIIDNRVSDETSAISEQSAYIMTKLLETVVTNRRGTAYSVFKGYSGAPKYVANVAVAAKTGSTNDDRDRYFVGYTPDYVAAVWFGYDNNKSLSSLPYNPAIGAWIEVFNRVYANLDSKGTAYRKDFAEPYGVVKVEYCSISGKLATDACRCDLESVLDETYSCIKTGYFTYDTVPTEYCDCHIMFKYDKSTGALCLDGCDCPAESLIDVALRKINLADRTFNINLKVADSQYTCVDPATIPAGYTYPTEINRAYYYNLLPAGTFPGRSESSSSFKPANRICITHYHPDKDTEE